MEKLLILPFDHRSSFIKKIAQTDDPSIVSDMKKVIFQAFLKVWENSSEKASLAILVDDQYCLDIISEASSKSINFTVALEKSGTDLFEFEHGEDFDKSLDQINPTYAKVLIRYNPDNKELNKLQLQNLEKLSLYAQNSGRKVILELLIPPTESEKSDIEKFEKVTRNAKTLQAIHEISSKIIPDIWKMEGFTKEGWQIIFDQTPFDMKVIVLGRGEDEKKVDEWLTTAAEFENIIGFAVGRTLFSKPLVMMKSGECSQEQAVEEIASNFDRLIKLWNDKKASSDLL